MSILSTSPAHTWRTSIRLASSSLSSLHRLSFPSHRLWLLSINMNYGYRNRVCIWRDCCRLAWLNSQWRSTYWIHHCHFSIFLAVSEHIHTDTDTYIKSDYTTLFLSDLSALPLQTSVFSFICFTFNVILQGPLNNKHRSFIFLFFLFFYSLNRAVSEGLCALSYTLSASRLMLSVKAHLTLNTDHCMRFSIFYLLHV